jgi:hypothetical protein
MKIILISTVQAFFRQRAGLFFVLLGLLFGFMSSREHYGFVLFFLKDPFGMYYLATIWTLYALLCAHFVSNLWTQPDYHFIFETRLWPNSKRLMRFMLMALGLLQPILYYGVYIILIARQDKLLHRIGPIFIFYTLLCAILVFVAEHRIRNPKISHTKGTPIFTWPFPRPVSWIYWSIEWLFREKGLTLLFCKIGAVGIAICTLLYYQNDSYDIRLPAIGLTLGYLLNVGLSYELFRWENEIWLWNRSLPVSRQVRFLKILLIHAILIIPETLIVLRYNVLSIFEVLQLYALGLSALLIFHTYLYKRGGLLEDAMKPVLSGFIILTLLILYKIPVWGISGTGFVLAGYLYMTWYGNEKSDL